MLNHSNILKSAFSSANDLANKKPEKISIGEHMIRTQMFLSMLSDMMPEIEKTVTNILDNRRNRKFIKNFEPTVKEEEKDWQECTEQGIGVSGI